jgi:farnesyl-diphosphate farnesyltransferase
MTETADQLLREVSRSFYLSIRALPRALRDPVALAYLLARTSDTIADTPQIGIDSRIEMLEAFSGAIQGKPANEIVAALQQNFAPGQENESEKKLISSAETFLRELVELPANDRADIRALLGTITRGQRLDLTRWRGGMTAVRTAPELREYTFLVAGCVGEFWTKLCFRKLSGFTARGEKEMMELGRKYGSGLQLVNVLRDAGDDLRAGRCYFPENELDEAGISATELPEAPARFLPVYQRWIAEARTGLDAGLEYCIAIDPPRVRIATVLPALIGVRTLELLEERGLATLRERVKVPRGEVRKIMASAAITLANQSRLRSKRARL